MDGPPDGGGGDLAAVVRRQGRLQGCSASGDQLFLLGSPQEKQGVESLNETDLSPCSKAEDDLAGKQEREGVGEAWII